MEKGINITLLLNSDILNYTFDFDQWPSQHTDIDKYLRPYSGSIFDLQFAYKSIFHEEKFKDVIGDIDDLNAGKSIDLSKIYKIKYVLSLIPSLGQHVDYRDVDGKQELFINKSDIPLMRIFSESDEFDIYNTVAL